MLTGHPVAKSKSIDETISTVPISDTFSSNILHVQPTHCDDHRWLITSGNLSTTFTNGIGLVQENFLDPCFLEGLCGSITDISLYPKFLASQLH
ncbi:hypothetical protein GDO81_011034 [Engystomops pustulosus]|uniref:Uncharacterized protein n=1 Tax=Engystomops pustulosus TaxID=76066 RepID=A0AAV7C544_ENGPU|nr:hypothetical protein GDO81_011034 [Engystomops pustulosus]